MPRPHKCRVIGARPAAMAFKPRGVPARGLETVELGLDEFEAIRLADFEGLYQDAAATEMGVSRATFGRLIERARHKVACALLDGKMLVVQGGIVTMRDTRTFSCADCNQTFEVAPGTGRPEACPTCGNEMIGRVADPGVGADATGSGRPRESGRQRGHCQRSGRRRRQGGPGRRNEQME